MWTFRPFLENQPYVLWNDSQDRRLKCPLHVINRLHAGIQVLDEEREADTYHETEDNSKDDVQRLVGFNRVVFPNCGVDNRHHPCPGQFDVHRFLAGFHCQHRAPAFLFLKPFFGGEIGSAGLRSSDIGLLQPVDLLVERI